MLVAPLADIHANREALVAVLAHARAAGVQRYVFLGDIVGYGADPTFAIDTVEEHVGHGAVALLGNHDAALENGSDGMNGMAAAAIAWTLTVLKPSHRAFLLAVLAPRA